MSRFKEILQNLINDKIKTKLFVENFCRKVVTDDETQIVPLKFLGVHLLCTVS